MPSYYYYYPSHKYNHLNQDRIIITIRITTLYLPFDLILKLLQINIITVHTGKCFD